MSRIAEARARAGKALPADESGRWDSDQEAAGALLSGSPASVRVSRSDVISEFPTRIAPTGRIGSASEVDSSAGDTSPALPREGGSHRLPPTVSPASAHAETTVSGAVAPGQAVRSATASPRFSAVKAAVPPVSRYPLTAQTDDSQLATMVRRVFLSRRRPSRSVLFCTPPGDRVSDVPWKVAESLAEQSGMRIAFVEDAANSVVPGGTTDRNGLITRIGWYPDQNVSCASAMAAAANARDVSRTEVSALSSDVLGTHVADLFSSFDFVILHATAPSADDLVPLAREVESVVLLITTQKTRRADAETLLETLRGSGAHLVGVVLIDEESETPDSVLNFNG